MRESIKCRAKNTISGSWVYGYYLLNHGINQIYTGNGFIPVHPNTVGQLTGFKDSVSEYEGDIVECMVDGEKFGENDIIEFRYACFWLRKRNIGLYEFRDNFNGDIKVIGNQFDNPELLK